MLLGVPKIIPPELLKILSEMGHGDEITLGDANFPGHTYGQTVVRMDGHGVPEILAAQPAMELQVTPGAPTDTPIWDTYTEIIARHDPRGADCVTEVERYAFYDRVKTKSCCVVMTGETATYANIILKKGVIA